MMRCSLKMDATGQKSDIKEPTSLSESALLSLTSLKRFYYAEKLYNSV